MMRRALELGARASEAGEVPVGAVVYETSSGRVLAEASNTRQTERDPAGHAEVVAIRLAATEIGDWRLSGATLVVTLEPCVMCAGLIVNARVGRLVYGCVDPKAGGVESLYRLCQDARLNHRITPVGGVMAEESSRMLKEFFRQRRGKKD
jgi:tRNA(adenine34) deaminase